MPVEREVKLEFPTGTDLPAPLGDTPATERHLDATYYDTTDLRLARFGATLRWRNDDGWTVKLPATVNGEVLSRNELHYAGDATQPPAAATGLVGSLTRGASLEPVARLQSLRRSVQLPRAELVDDEVLAFDGDGQPLSAFREVELELADDADSATIGATVDALVAAGGSKADPRPKLVRALGSRATAPADVVVPPVSPEPTAREVIRAAMAGSVRTLILRLPGVRLDEDTEDVHQARVAIRRLRSNLRSFGWLIERPWADSLDVELKWLLGLLGRIRDDDVAKIIISDLPLAGRGVDEVARAIESDRQEARRELLAALDSERANRLLDRLVVAAADPHVAPQADDPADERLPGLVRKPWKKLQRAVNQLGPDPEDEQLHRVRILAKRCRYAADAVKPAVGQPAADFAKAIARIQDALGDLNDAAVITGRLGVLAERLSTEGAFAAGQVSGILIERAVEHRDEWEAAWARASKKKRRAWFA